MKSLAEQNAHLDLAAHAFGSLADSERAAFERHLASCAECRSELTELRETAAVVWFAAPSSTPPAALAGRTFAAVERETTHATPVRPRRRSWRWPTVAVGAGTAAAAAALVLALGIASPPGELELQAELSAPSGSAVASASVDVRETGIGRVITFRSESLPILPKGDYYELWFVGPGDRPGRRNRISAGTFHPDERRALARPIRRGGRPSEVPGAERHGRARRRRPPADGARGAALRGG